MSEVQEPRLSTEAKIKAAIGVMKQPDERLSGPLKEMYREGFVDGLQAALFYLNSDD